MSQASDNFLIYDGDCPFCSRYARMTKLREAIGNLRLIDARSSDPEVISARGKGYVLDEGMLLRLDGRFYHGADCLNRLALLSSRSTLFNRMSYRLLRWRWTARLAYPALRMGRGLALVLLGRPPLGY
jgi:predicted DCC family thiol-disulfide oxidoreductase YuxK